MNIKKRDSSIDEVTGYGLYGQVSISGSGKHISSRHRI
jgi:hypothetical protein